VVIVHGQADLLQIVDALDAPRGFTRRLNGRQQKRDQNRNDGDDDQELDQSEAGSTA
jgi:hypothetical protein